MMKFLRLLQTTSAVTMLVIASGPAFAGDATVANTGPGSNVDITQSTDTNVDLSNSNKVQITTTNAQHALTGDAEIASNTTGGNAKSGDATNNLTATTTIVIDNATSVTVGGSGGGSGVGPGGGSGVGPGVGRGGGLGGGSVQGASTGGSGSGEAVTLPDVGAKFPVDVSFLRSIYNPSSASGSTVANQTHRASTMLLLIALLLSGLAGAGSYVSKRASSG